MAFVCPQPHRVGDNESEFSCGNGDALLAVDVQRDFLAGGALAVPDGDAVVAPLNRMIERFHAAALPVIASRDWHPLSHCSFKPQGGPWPPHCVADTAGAQFATALRLPRDAIVVSKGTSLDRDAYSAFDGTELATRLRSLGVRRLIVGGLATDYCVQASVLDARRSGFEVVVLEDAIRAVDAAAGDSDRALERMRRAGAQFARTPTSP